MSLSPSPKLKFLLDENVKKRVEKFLKSEGFDVIAAPKGVSNGRLAEFSKSEKRVLVTNDWDFTDTVAFPKEKVFSLVLLEIPQDRPEAFPKAFSLLLKEKANPGDFEGYLIVLKEDSFESSPIISKKSIK